MAARTASTSSRSAASGVTRSFELSGRRARPATSHPSASRRCATFPPLMPVTPATSARRSVIARLAPANLAVDNRARDDQESLEDVLPLLIEAEEHRRVQDLNAQAGAHQRPDERAAAPEEARAAEDDRSDGRERVAGPLTRVADAELCQQDDCTEEGEKRSAQVTEQGDSVHRHSDPPRGLLVRPDCAQAHAEARPPESE